MKKIAKLMFIIISIIFISTNVNAKETDNLTLYVFKGDGCPHCKAEMDYLDTIKDKYTNLEIKEYDGLVEAVSCWQEKIQYWN